MARTGKKTVAKPVPIKGLITVDMLDGRELAVRRFRELCRVIEDDLGGPEAMTVLKKSMIENLAMLSILISNLNAQALTGTDIDPEKLGKLSKDHASLCRTLGFKPLDLKNKVETLDDVLEGDAE